MPEWTGTVVATSKYGIKAVEGGGWLNWSLPDMRGTPFDEVEKGDKVRIEYAEVERDGVKKTYISVIENLSHPGGPEAPVGTRLTESPFPPDEAAAPPGHPLVEESPPAFEVTPGAPSEPVEPVLDRDHSIVRQTCVKAASVALQHNMGSAEEKAGMIAYLAGVLEDWCWR